MQGTTHKVKSILSPSWLREQTQGNWIIPHTHCFAGRLEWEYREVLTAVGDTKCPREEVIVLRVLDLRSAFKCQFNS